MCAPSREIRINRHVTWVGSFSDDAGFAEPAAVAARHPYAHAAVPLLPAAGQSVRQSVNQSTGRLRNNVSLNVASTLKSSGVC